MFQGSRMESGTMRRLHAGMLAHFIRRMHASRNQLLPDKNLVLIILKGINKKN